MELWGQDTEKQDNTGRKWKKKWKKKWNGG